LIPKPENKIIKGKMGTINRPCQLTNNTTAKVKNIKIVRAENINTDFIFFIKGITPKEAKIYTG